MGRAEHAERLSVVARLDGPVVDAPASMPALRDALHRATGLSVICDPASWAATVPPAPTWNALLDGLVSQGLRWVYADGAVYVTR